MSQFFGSGDVSQTPDSQLVKGQKDSKRQWQWYDIVSETRTQILLCYVALMVTFVGVSIPVIYRELHRQIDLRLQAEVVSELNEFHRDLAIAQPQDFAQLRTFMLSYLQEERIEEDQFFIIILDRQFVQSSPDTTHLPVHLQPGSELMTLWETIEQPTVNHLHLSDAEAHGVLYAAEQVQLQGQTRGVFVVAHITGDERQEASTALWIVFKSMMLFIAVATLIAWGASGQILKPLRLMSATARKISESDLSQRIQVKGQGELAEIAKTFNEMMDRLEISFISQQNFINDASHELRTPITIIQGHLDLMSDDPEEQAETLAIVNDELNRMNRFVKDMLLLAKAKQPNFIRIEPLALEELTEDLYNKAKVLVKCDCCLDQKASGTIYTDRQRLTQAIMNLVDNANQHTPEQGVVALGSVKDQHTVRFWVRDTGTGIEPTEQQRIFERFARGSTNPRSSEGAGLGLAIVQAIATALGGQIELSSSLGKGSMFVLVLPLKPAS
jgi:signal transduction histidine kinase